LGFSLAYWKEKKWVQSFQFIEVAFISMPSFLLAPLLILIFSILMM
jgi:ABC-type dipeptide/oligopeptide/nickel transport system permease component